LNFLNYFFLSAALHQAQQPQLNGVADVSSSGIVAVEEKLDVNTVNVSRGQSGFSVTVWFSSMLPGAEPEILLRKVYMLVYGCLISKTSIST